MKALKVLLNVTPLLMVMFKQHSNLAQLVDSVQYTLLAMSGGKSGKVKPKEQAISGKLTTKHYITNKNKDTYGWIYMCIHQGQYKSSTIIFLIFFIPDPNYTLKKNHTDDKYFHIMCRSNYWTYFCWFLFKTWLYLQKKNQIFPTTR